jgi:hypothetical protein
MMSGESTRESQRLYDSAITAHNCLLLLVEKILCLSTPQARPAVPQIPQNVVPALQGEHVQIYGAVEQKK